MYRFTNMKVIAQMRQGGQLEPYCCQVPLFYMKQLREHTVIPKAMIKKSMQGSTAEKARQECKIEYKKKNTYCMMIPLI